MKKTKNVLVAIMTLFMVSSGFVFPFANVEAAGNGTGGGNSGGGGGAGYWQQVSGTAGTSQAWDQFSRYNNWEFGQNFINSTVDSAGRAHGNNNLRKQCQSSRYIWWFGKSSSITGGWSTYHNNNSHRSPWARSRNQADWNDFQKWGKKQWDSGTTIIICSGSYEQIERNCDKTNYREKKSSDKIDGVYASNTTLTPMTRAEYRNYSAQERKIWDAEHEAQSSNVEKSNFGKWYDKEKKNIEALKNKKGTAYEKERDRLKKGAADAKKGDYIAHPNIKMSGKNQTGFGKGGVYNVVEGQSNMSITLGTITKEKQLVKCTEKKNANGQWVKTEKPGKWTKYDTVQDGKTTSKLPTDAQLLSMSPTLYWQMLNARCNKNGVDAATSEINGKGKGNASSLNNNGATASSAIKTPVYKSVKDMPLGQTNEKGTLGETAHDPFYTKLAGCQELIACVSDPKSASKTSEATKNVQDTGTKLNNKYGAQGVAIDGANKKNDVSSDKFTFFRDNKENDVRLDVWYPIVTRAGTGIDINDTKAKNTYLYFDPKGTPNGKGLVSVTAGGQTFDGPDLTNNKPKLYNGEVNELKVAGSWASEGANPHKVNATWLTEPEVTSNVWTNVNGNGSADGVTKNKSKIRVGCRMKLNAKDGNEPSIEPDPSLPIDLPNQFDNKDDRFAEFNFVRSGSGLNQSK